MITAVILAAGEGSRMGTLKQLLPWEDSTILETVIKNIAETRFVDDEIRVILGAQADRIEKILSCWDEKRLKVLRNNNYKEGMLTTVRQGIKDIPITTEYIMLALGDQPLITTDIFNLVLKECLRKKPDIMVPVVNGKRGHPLLINKRLIPEIHLLKKQGGLRNLLHKYPERVYHFNINDESIIVDLDYYEDYQKHRR
ncbi:putative MobA-like protein [Halobacteroides halobius DSM 5150]|uniref:Putative MobA-like protein n=1 Tax=Halobacteroides halobius (strain ATCC 35273 / DSM 5150 / MD-1) TaxID=748449 RepID=L0K7M4_HALHC|nr:nucleotidyltransferase family protein [Halobacteroides halobius]AGB41016.1 putative MobA-like protein [Halobacteroides halobius DSM 5150]